MRFCVFCLAALWMIVCGCVSVDRDAQRAIDALRSGNNAQAEAWSTDLAEDSYYSKNLGVVEAGRVAMLSGRFADGVRRFRSAMDSAVDRTESEPKLKVGDLANTAMSSTITDDRTREYYLPPYELNMAIEYGILSQIFTGKREDALADARLAVYVQDSFAGLYGADATSEPEGMTEQARGLIEEQNSALESMIAASRNSWENPLLWWLTGVLFEADGDLEAAWQSYRKASAVKPECAVFAKDAARAEGSATPRSGRSKLIVMYEQDFVPVRESLKIPVPIYTGFSFDIPKYSTTTLVERVSVSGCKHGCEAGVAVDVCSLAARDLKEKLPGIIVRNLTRAAVQAGAQASANAAGNNYVKLAVFAGNMVVSAIRRADTRSWVTLPAMQHIWCDSDMSPGEYSLCVGADGSSIPVKVSLSPGETRIVWIAKTGTVWHGVSACIGGAGAPLLDLRGKEIKR